METHMNHNYFERRPIFKSKAPAIKWIKEWVPQEVVATGGKCFVLKWVNENTFKSLKDKAKEPNAAEPEPEQEPTTEVLFLCSYEGCGKTFIDAGALRKHSHIHGERQYICHYEGCGKKFLDSSKLKRHFLIHTGERDFVCPFEGCGKAFSLDFNLRSHMKTHSQENYHVCPFPECGKRYAHEYKLKNHLATHHDKTGMDLPKYTPPPAEKPPKIAKTSTITYASASSDRPYACRYEGCGKAYIHEYKLKLHLRREHPGHISDENAGNAQNNNNDNEMDEGSDQDNLYARSKRGSSKNQKQNKPKPSLKMPPSKTARKGGGSSASPANLNALKKQWPVKEEAYDEEDSEETEEDRDNGEGWRYTDNNIEDDDEETEYED